MAPGVTIEGRNRFFSICDHPCITAERRANILRLDNHPGQTRYTPTLSRGAAPPGQDAGPSGFCNNTPKVKSVLSIVNGAGP